MMERMSEKSNRHRKPRYSLFSYMLRCSLLFFGLSFRFVIPLCLGRCLSVRFVTAILPQCCRFADQKGSRNYLPYFLWSLKNRFSQRQISHVQLVFSFQTLWKPRFDALRFDYLDCSAYSLRQTSAITWINRENLCESC